jgi:hypothetical protein
LTLASGTTFQVDNTGASLGVGTYVVIAAGSGGSVDGTAPESVTVGGGGTDGSASLQINGGQLELVVTAGNPPPSIVSIMVSGGTATVNFSGTPSYSYEIQRSTNLLDWATLLTTNAPGGGLFEFVDDFSDLENPPGSAFYRAAQP